MILDTNAISALAVKDKLLIHALGKASRLAVTFISLGEYSYGVRRSAARRELDSWLRKHFLTRVDVLIPDLSTVEHYADVRYELQRAGTPIPANDVWIAALVRQYDLPLLSLDTAWIGPTGLLVNTPADWLTVEKMCDWKISGTEQSP